jgi:hypothetical protein
MEIDMNERIRQLAKQAILELEKDVKDGKKDWYHSTQSYDEMVQEKFAELIIQECATLTLDHRSDDYYQGWLDYRDEIRRHFGVES